MTNTTQHDEKVGAQLPFSGPIHITAPSGQVKTMQLRWRVGLGVCCALTSLLFAGCGSSERYFMGMVTLKPVSPSTSSRAIALTARVAADGTATLRYGTFPPIVEGTGTLSGNNFSGQIPLNGTGTLTLQGTEQKPKTSGTTMQTAIMGTATLNSVKIGEFAIGDDPEAKKMYEMH